VDGIDGVYVGPSDLGLSLGYEPTLEPTEAAVIEAIAEIAARTRAAGLIAGVHTGSATMIKAMFERGFHFASLLTDARLFTNALAKSLAEVRDTTAQVVSGY